MGQKIKDAFHKIGTNILSASVISTFITSFASLTPKAMMAISIGTAIGMVLILIGSCEVDKNV